MAFSIMIRRLVGLAATLAVASGLVFLATEILPGDPAEVMLGADARPDTLAALRHELGLDHPAPERYARWVLGMAHGDFGISHTYATPVIRLVAERIPVSLPLAVASLALTLVIALPLGVIAGSQRGRLADTLIRGVAQIGLAFPNIWLALLLVLVFAISLHWLPAGGFPGWQASPSGAVRALILPSLALALPQAAILSRIMRAALLDTIDDTYVVAARARGLSRGRAIVSHALRNALLPVIAVIGLQFSFLLAGTILIENIFSLPGIGRLIFQAVNQRDATVIRSVAMLLVLSVACVAFLADLVSLAIDPRVRRTA